MLKKWILHRHVTLIVMIKKVAEGQIESGTIPRFSHFLPTLYILSQLMSKTYALVVAGCCNPKDGEWTSPSISRYYPVMSDTVTFCNSLLSFGIPPDRIRVFMNDSFLDFLGGECYNDHSYSIAKVNLEGLEGQNGAVSTNGEHYGLRVKESLSSWGVGKDDTVVCYVRSYGGITGDSWVMTGPNGTTWSVGPIVDMINLLSPKTLILVLDVDCSSRLLDENLKERLNVPNLLILCSSMEPTVDHGAFKRITEPEAVAKALGKANVYVSGWFLRILLRYIVGNKFGEEGEEEDLCQLSERICAVGACIRERSRFVHRGTLPKKSDVFTGRTVYSGPVHQLHGWKQATKTGRRNPRTPFDGVPLKTHNRGAAKRSPKKSPTSKL